MESFRTRASTALGFLFLLLAAVDASQGQTNAQLTVTQEIATAGDPVSVAVTLDQPAACDTMVRVNFYTASQAGQARYNLQIAGRIRTGESSATVETKLLLDQMPGTYSSLDGYLDPCPGFGNAKRFQVPSRTLVVKAYLDPAKYPTTAEVALVPTQRQFFDTKIEQLGDLDGQITTRLEGNAADVYPVRAFLMQIVQTAEEELSTTEAQYRAQIMKPSDALPAFFEDFRQQYQGLLSDLNAPIPGTAAWVHPGASLAYVQLSRRSPAVPDNAPRTPLGTYSPDVTAVRKAVNENAAAYRYVRKTGRITFDARIASYPTGARVQYKKVIDLDYSDYSSPTDIPKVTLDLAYWVFKFQKDGCTDQPTRQIDPYEDSEPDIFYRIQGLQGEAMMDWVRRAPRWMGRTVLFTLPLSGYLPMLTNNRVHAPSVVWPPIGSVVEYAGGAASVFVALIGKLPSLSNTKAAVGNWFRAGIFGGSIALGIYAYCLLTFVKGVDTPHDGTQYRTIGSERTPYAALCPQGSSDEDLLKCGGLEDGDIEKLWTPSSVRRARFALFVSYVGVLGSIGLLLESSPRRRASS